MTYPSANEMFRAAQVLVREGQPVFPCWPNGVRVKSPMVSNGLYDATLDLKKIQHWWRRNGTSAIGIPTGILYDVLDVDIKDGVDGRAHLPYLNRLGLLDGCQKVAKTPSGGWHLYFLASKTNTNKGRAATLGLDVRATGGYVLAAPSYIETDDYSGAYVEHPKPVGSNSDPLMWPLIMSALVPTDTRTNNPVQLLPSERHASVAALREWITTLGVGERNNGFHWAVCRCIDNGIDPVEMIEPALLIGLTETEVNKTVGSALKRAGLDHGDLLSEVDALFPDAA